VVVRTDFLNGLVDDTVLVMLTGRQYGIPGTEVELDPAKETGAGLSKVRYASCNNLLTRDEAVIGPIIGCLSDAAMQRMGDCPKKVPEVWFRIIPASTSEGTAMPVHDWTRVDAGVLHAFHVSWICHLMKSLNSGLLPRNCYALIEQAAATTQPDLPIPRIRPRGRHLAIRHVPGHQVVALLKIVSPLNKNRRASIRHLAEEIARRLRSGGHVLLLDLVRGASNYPRGMHGAVWEHFSPTPYTPPTDRPFAVTSYVGRGSEPEVYLVPVAVGQPLTDMPLFLSPDYPVNVPLEGTYMAAYHAMPEHWRSVIEGNEPGAG
jgi:hypothetical protein